MVELSEQSAALFIQIVKKCSAFIDPEGSSLYSQQYTLGPY